MNRIFLEIQSVNFIQKPNQYSPKTFHYLDLNSMKFIFMYAIHSQKSIRIKSQLFSRYLIAYVYKMIAGNYTRWTSFKFSGEVKLGDQRGFLAMNNPKVSQWKDTNDLIKRKIISVVNGEKKVLNDSRQVYREKLHELIKLAQGKEVELYFIISPRLPDYFDVSYLLDDQKIKQRTINLSDGKHYPQFYLKKFSYDIGHLNEVGANIYSSVLANQFYESILENKSKND